MTQTQQLKAVDFFCGAGGVTCGFKSAGINVLAGIDIDITCKDTYEKNNPGSIFLERDIAIYTPKALKADLEIKQNDDNMVFVGCSPCQYYTYINTSKQKSEKSKLLLEEFQKFIKYFKPGFIFIENVPGLDKNAQSPLSNFKKFLTKNKYNFSEEVVNAKYFGVPQNRRRYVLLASRVTQIQIPKGDKKNLKSVAESIGDKKVFPPIAAGHKDETDFIHSTSGIKEINFKRLQSTSKNGGSRTEWAGIEALQLECYKTHNGHSDVYGRMSWEKVAPTITTKFNSISNGRYGHPDQDRAISLREGATLQSFPTDYNFYANSQGKIARMIGNAVPPRLAYKIATAFNKPQNDATQ